jgi:hypothetical protein
MKKKALLIGLIAYFIILSSTFTVSAIDEYEEYTDDEDDVMDILGETGNRPNIDITNVKYSRNGLNVKITLTVKGNIQNAGDINNIEEFPMVLYNILLATDTNDYDIYYINKIVNLSSGDEDVSYDVDGSDLEISFQLESAEEVYDSMIIFTTDFSSMTEFFLDEFSSEPIDTLDVDAGGPYEGKTGESIKFSGSVDSGTGPYEWEWDFDGDFIPDSTEQNPTWTYDTEDEYDVTLTVIDSFGETGYDFTTVTIIASENGNNNSGNDEGSPLILFVGLIVIIVIAGVAVLVFVIRR